MSDFEVEVVRISKHYSRTTVEAESRKEAILKAKSINTDDYEQTESSNQVEWIAKPTGGWSFSNWLYSIFKK